jgi:hypothetical protein
MIRHVIGALSDSSAGDLLGELRTPTLVLHRAEIHPAAEAHQRPR